MPGMMKKMPAKSMPKSKGKPAAPAAKGMKPATAKAAAKGKMMKGGY
jgi:hypothetical protein